MKTGNTQSPSRQSATTPRGTGRLGKSIVAGLMAALILAVFLAAGLQAPPNAQAQTITTVPLNWDLTPSGLVAGNQFRLMFITHTGHKPSSSGHRRLQRPTSRVRPPPVTTAIRQYSSGFTLVRQHRR